VGCLVKPSGGKYGFGERVKITRQVGAKTCAGLLDRDFDDDASPPRDTLRPWRVDGDKTWLGWIWERREIENYLLDPAVVQGALGERAPQSDRYWLALSTAATSITDYTAARYALSLSRVRFSPLPNDWGTQRGKDGHPFPDDRSEPDCRQAISTIVQTYQQCQIVTEDEVFQRFESLSPTCRPGGIRFEHFLTFFAGRDLLYALEPWLATAGFASAGMFREALVKGIEKAAEVWTWLPEWRILRETVQTVSM
jgi:hypothetical protein